MKANILDRRRFAMGLAGIVLWSVGAASGLAAWTFFNPAAAQSVPATMGPGPVTRPDLFVANAVPVDVTAASVTEARERGLTQGRVVGFRKVLSRLVARDDLNNVPELTAVQIIDMVRDFSIANERSSAVRYLADLTVRFDPVTIRRLLRNANIPFTETLSKPLVVVPLMREDANANWKLWEEANAWRGAWSLVPPDLGLVSLIVPAGSGEDAALLNADQAAAKDLTALNQLADRYGAGGTVLAMATGAPEGMQMTLVELRNDLPSAELSLIQSAEPGQARDQLFAAATTAAAEAVQENWKQRNRVAFGGTTQITALVPVSDLREWLTVKNRLNEVPLIDRLELQAITRDRAQISLYYAGAQRQLELAMSQHDLALTQQDDVWIIQVRGGVSATRVLGEPGVETRSLAEPTLPEVDSSPPGAGPSAPSAEAPPPGAAPPQ